MTDPIDRLLTDFRAYCLADARLQADAEASARLRGDRPNPAPMPLQRPFARPEASQPPYEASPEVSDGEA